MKLFSGNSLWQLVLQSDSVSWFVLLTLLCMSISCWTIFFYKLSLNKLKQKQIDDILNKLFAVRSLQELLVFQQQISHTIPGQLIAKGMRVIDWQLESNAKRGIQGILAEQADDLEQQLYQAADELVHKEESYMSLLSTSGAIAPLLGLFGTVWGLIHAFVGISQSQSADIAAVAPGIAQALTTTLAGLIVAIPAVVMFNYLSWKIRSFEQKVVTLVERVYLIMQRI